MTAMRAVSRMVISGLFFKRNCVRIIPNPMRPKPDKILCEELTRVSSFCSAAFMFFKFLLRLELVEKNVFPILGRKTGT